MSLSTLIKLFEMDKLRDAYFDIGALQRHPSIRCKPFVNMSCHGAETKEAS